MGALVHWLNKYLSAVLFSHGGAWDITDKGEDGLWQRVTIHPPTPITDMSHSLMTLLCLLSLHLICASVKSERPTPAPPDSRANTHPFNDITFGVMPFSVALILSSICIIQPVTQPELRPIKSWSFPHPLPPAWQMSRWKLAIIYCSCVFITGRHDVSLCSELSGNASVPDLFSNIWSGAGVHFILKTLFGFSSLF